MKKLFFPMLMLILIFGLSSSIVAQTDSTKTADEPEKLCVCGRHLKNTGTNQNEKYECENCGKIMSNCICTCWCGSKVKRDEKGLLICLDCDHYCTDCEGKGISKASVEELEQKNRAGQIVLGSIEKPDNITPIIIILVIATIIAISYAFFFVALKKKFLREREKKEKLLMRSHKKILDKIAEQSYRNTDNSSMAKRAVEKAVKWKISRVKGGIVAYELLNSIHFNKQTKKEMSPLSLYIMNTVLDEENAKIAALNGNYGDFIKNGVISENNLESGKTILDIKQYYEEDFFEENKIAIRELLGEHGILEKQSHKLISLPCTGEIRIGSAKATAEHWATEFFEECSVKADYKATSGHRFEYKNYVGGENK